MSARQLCVVHVCVMYLAELLLLPAHVVVRNFPERANREIGINGRSIGSNGHFCGLKSLPKILDLAELRIHLTKHLDRVEDALVLLAWWQSRRAGLLGAHLDVMKIHRA